MESLKFKDSFGNSNLVGDLQVQTKLAIFHQSYEILIFKKPTKKKLSGLIKL